MSRKNRPVSRADIQRIEGYIPGEQPQEPGWTKLNTNENPYPPSPRAVRAIRATASERLNVYPDPLAKRFREVAAKLYGVEPDCILPGNGSDEILTILMRTFVDAGQQVASPYPSYTLYETLASIQGAKFQQILLNADWSWNWERTREIVDASQIVFVPNPNSPSGNLWGNDDLLKLIPPEGPLILDEAYADFRDEPRKMELLTGEMGGSVVVTRTLSKSYSLAGIRFGFAIADPVLVAEMRKVKDSYNCNALSLAAAVVALEDQEWMEQNLAKIHATRKRMTDELESLEFNVVPSQANFVWATHPSGKHREIYEELKRRKVLVRYMQFLYSSEVDGQKTAGEVDGLRITVGTDEEVDRFFDELRGSLSTID